MRLQKERKAKGEKDKKATWTIMLYIVADDGLANFAVESLKQLRDTADSNVLVAAQFDADGSAQLQEIRRFIFGKNADKDKPLSQIEWPRLPADVNMSKPEVLTDFIKWAMSECETDRETDRYCLILWGHGPELLFEAPLNDTRVYLTPVELKKALQAAGFGNNKKLDIIGMDACSMSMIEYAYELKGLARFMVASQEEVPDLSFPYNRIVAAFSKHSDPEELCKSGLKDYAQTYRDYICTPGTGMRKVTLSCLKLDQIEQVAESVSDLAKALGEVDAGDNGGGLILKARSDAKGFVGGIFVDLVSFCRHVLDGLGRKDMSKQQTANLKKACEAVCKALEPAQGHCVVANDAVDDRCHGLSIYFPYLTEDDINGLNLIKGPGGSQQDTVKGPNSQLDTLKGVGGSQQDTGKAMFIANLAGRSILYAVRRAIIDDTEEYYASPQCDFRNKGWYEFIANKWCEILVKNKPTELDLRYSAQRIAQNLNDAKNRDSRKKTA